ncbi:hypothetical protein D3C76_1862490 [compost metagenome]
MRFVEFHGLGVRFKKPQPTVGVHPQIHGHFPEQEAGFLLDLLGDQERARFDPA